MENVRRILAALTALLMLLCVTPAGIITAEGDIPIDEAHFPDAKFREAVLAYESSSPCNHDTYLSQDEINAKTELNLNSREIADLTGIGYFTALKKLQCRGNKLTGLDLSQNTALEEVDCRYNQELPGIDLSNAAALKLLNCEDCDKLTGINLTNAAALEKLQCNGCALLESVNLTGASALKTLICSSCAALTSINLTGTSALQELNCSSCAALPTLDLSDCAALTKLQCSSCAALTGINFTGASALKEVICSSCAALQTLDLSGHSALERLSCGHSNKLTEINLNGASSLTKLDCDNCALLTGIDFTGTSALKEVNCYYCAALQTLDLSGHSALETLKCYTCKALTGIDLTGASSLKTLQCYTCDMLQSLDLSDCAALETLDCGNDKALTSINLNGASSLKTLKCSTCALLESIDLTGTSALLNMDCNSCRKLPALDLSDCASLTKLNCSSCGELIDLNLNGAAALKELNCGSCGKLPTLDLSHNNALEKLSCSSCSELTGINLTDAAALKELNCGSCGKLPTLDLSDCSALTKLLCQSCGMLTSLNLNGASSLRQIEGSCPLTSLDLSHNPALWRFSLTGCNMPALDLSNHPALDYVNFGNQIPVTVDASGCPAMTRFSCISSHMTSLDLSGDAALKTLACSHNQLTALDLSTCAAMEEVSCDDNQLSELNLNGADALWRLNCESNELTSLDVSHNANLKSLHCPHNLLTEFNLNGAAALETFNCSYNPMTGVDVSHNANLESFACERCPQLASLDVSQNKKLTYITCHYCGSLASLNADGAIALKYIWCHDSHLETLNVGDNPALETIDVFRNYLTSLDVSSCKALGTLACWNNQLSSLIVHGLDKLRSITCQGNQLTELDLSGLPALTSLNCGDIYGGNHLTNLDLSETGIGERWESRLQTYVVSSNPFDLGSLPGHFEVFRASNWRNGTVSGNMLTFDSGKTSVSYTYNCDYQRNLFVTLELRENGTITIVNPRAAKTYNAYRVFELVCSPDSPETPPESYAYSIKGVSPWFTAVSDYAEDPAHGLKLTQSASNTNHYSVEFASADNPIEGYGAFDPVDFARYLTDNIPDDAEVTAWRASGQTPTGAIRLTTDGNLPSEGNVYTPANYRVSLGYYFVTTGVGAFCSLDSADPDAYIYDKNDAPGWDAQPGSALALGKVVAAENPDASPNPGSWGSTSEETIGTGAWFKIMAHVPSYEYGRRVAQYVFTDILGAGFTYDAGSLEITLYPALDTNGVPAGAPVTLYDSGHTGVQGVNAGFAGDTLTVKLQLADTDEAEETSNAIDIDGADGDENYYPDAHIVIRYKTHVNENAVYDNINTAKMDWTWADPDPALSLPPMPSTEPSPEPSTEPSPEPAQPAVPADAITHTYVYGFPFSKTIMGSDPLRYLPGAEFELYSDRACDHKISLVADNTLPAGAPAQPALGSGGIRWTYYRVADAAETAAAGFESKKIEAGRAVIWGLAPGTYYLKETKTPDGYNLLAEPFPVTICAGDDPNTAEVTEVKNVDGKGYVPVGTINVENAAGVPLPSVGGSGAKIFYIVGGLLMTAAAAALTARKKMSVFK